MHLSELYTSGANRCDQNSCNLMITYLIFLLRIKLLRSSFLVAYLLAPYIYILEKHLEELVITVFQVRT